jgi:hypothetical protein
MAWTPQPLAAGQTRKLIKFLIMFDNSNLLFFPGQFLSGRVIVEVEEDMAVMGKKERRTTVDFYRRPKSTPESKINLFLFCSFVNQIVHFKKWTG